MYVLTVWGTASDDNLNKTIKLAITYWLGRKMYDSVKTKPRLLQQMDRPNGTVLSIFLQWLISHSGDVQIKKSSVITSLGLQSGYQATGSFSNQMDLFISIKVQNRNNKEFGNNQ